MRKLNRHRIPVLFCAFALLLTVAFLLAGRGRHRIVTLPDGLSIEFLGVTVGTNRLPHGSVIQRLLANHIPPKGLKLGPWTIGSPMFLHGFSEADVDAWLLARGPSLGRGLSYDWNGSEVVTSNRFGRQLSIPTARPFIQSTNQVVFRVPLIAFPRNDRTVILRFSPPAERAERLWIEFPFRNPLFNVGSTWAPPLPPITNRFDGHEFILSTAKAGQLIFNLPSSDWQIPFCRLFDNEGNAAGWSRAEGPLHGKIRMFFDHSLETNRPWRVEATFAYGRSADLKTDFPPEQLRTVHLTPTQPATLTNLSGEVFTVRIERSGLEIHTQDRTGLPCWTILNAKDENNQPVGFSRRPGWMYRWSASGSLTQRADLLKSYSSLDLQLACPPSFTAQFFVLPEP